MLIIIIEIAKINWKLEKSMLLPIMDKNKFTFILILRLTLEVFLLLPSFSMDSSKRKSYISSPHFLKCEGPLLLLAPEMSHKPCVYCKERGGRNRWNKGILHIAIFHAVRTYHSFMCVFLGSNWVPIVPLYQDKVERRKQTR